MHEARALLLACKLLLRTAALAVAGRPFVCRDGRMKPHQHEGHAARGMWALPQQGVRGGLHAGMQADASRANQIYQLSRDPVHEFPLAVVSLNVTLWTVQVGARRRHAGVHA